MGWERHKSNANNNSNNNRYPLGIEVPLLRDEASTAMKVTMETREYK